MAGHRCFGCKLVPWLVLVCMVKASLAVKIFDCDSMLLGYANCTQEFVIDRGRSLGSDDGVSLTNSWNIASTDSQLEGIFDNMLAVAGADDGLTHCTPLSSYQFSGSTAIAKFGFSFVELRKAFYVCYTTTRAYFNTDVIQLLVLSRENIMGSTWHFEVRDYVTDISEYHAPFDRFNDIFECNANLNNEGCYQAPCLEALTSRRKVLSNTRQVTNVFGTTFYLTQFNFKGLDQGDWCRVIITKCPSHGDGQICREYVPSTNHYYISGTQQVQVDYTVQSAQYSPLGIPTAKQLTPGNTIDTFNESTESDNCQLANSSVTVTASYKAGTEYSGVAICFWIVHGSTECDGTSLGNVKWSESTNTRTVTLFRCDSRLAVVAQIECGLDDDCSSTVNQALTYVSHFNLSLQTKVIGGTLTQAELDSADLLRDKSAYEQYLQASPSISPSVSPSASAIISPSTTSPSISPTGSTNTDRPTLSPSPSNTLYPDISYTPNESQTQDPDSSSFPIGAVVGGIVGGVVLVGAVGGGILYYNKNRSSGAPESSEPEMPPEPVVPNPDDLMTYGITSQIDTGDDRTHMRDDPNMQIDV